MDCNRCGKCCINPILALHNIPIDKDINELGRWLSYHGCSPFKFNNGKEEVLAIRLKSKCEHLETKDGIFYTCKIYKTRPQVCKDYFCKESIDREVKKLVKEVECIAPT